MYDCFSYFNEREILELRLRLLHPHVDGFIITDANRTHSGEPKNFSCKHTLEQLNINCSNIQVLEVELPSLDEQPNNWTRERLQRDSAAVLFEPDSVYIVSDADEIINPNFVPLFAEAAINNPQLIFRPNLAWLNARADLRVCDPKAQPAAFSLPFVCLHHHTLSHTLSEIREDQACELYSLPYSSRFLLDHKGNPVDCGWHFSWMGGRDSIKTKMRSYAHSRDPQQGIFSTAVGAVNSVELHQYLNNYKPQSGSNDPYGRSDYFLGHYPRENLPQPLMDLTHLHPYFFGDFD